MNLDAASLLGGRKKMASKQVTVSCLVWMIYSAKLVANGLNAEHSEHSCFPAKHELLHVQAVKMPQEQ